MSNKNFSEVVQLICNEDSRYERGAYYFLRHALDSTLTSIQGFQAKDADLTITIKREDLEMTMMGAVSFDDQIKSGKAKLMGDRVVYEEFKVLLIHFDLGFALMPGTIEKDLTPEKKPFQCEDFPRGNWC